MNALNIAEYVQALGLQAKTASALMARADAATKNRALRALARRLREVGPALAEANGRDLARATAAGLSAPMVDRLKLTPRVLATLAEGCEQLAAMPDAIGEITGMKQQPSGIRVGQMRVPIGVFGMVYESRPNVTIEAASLAIKSGNAAILRGGSEAIESNKALAAAGGSRRWREAGLPVDAVQLVPTTDREAVGQLIAMPQYRRRDHSARRQGADRAHQRAAPRCRSSSTWTATAMSMSTTRADLGDGRGKIADNAKTQKYSPCNATESLLGGARAWRRQFLPQHRRDVTPPRVLKCAATRRLRASCARMRLQRPPHLGRTLLNRERR